MTDDEIFDGALWFYTDRYGDDFDVGVSLTPFSEEDGCPCRLNVSFADGARMCASFVISADRDLFVSGLGSLLSKSTEHIDERLSYIESPLLY